MDQRLRAAMCKLKRDFPLNGPVRVQTVDELVNDKNEQLHGCAWKDEDMFHIAIQRHVDISVQIHILWHEWTHCLVWPRCIYRHSARFWRVYGQIYSHYQD